MLGRLFQGEWYESTGGVHAAARKKNAMVLMSDLVGLAVLLQEQQTSQE